MITLQHKTQRHIKLQSRHFSSHFSRPSFQVTCLISCDYTGPSPQKGTMYGDINDSDDQSFDRRTVFDHCSRCPPCVPEPRLDSKTRATSTGLWVWVWALFFVWSCTSLCFFPCVTHAVTLSAVMSTTLSI